MFVVLIPCQAMKLDKGFCSGQAIDLRFSRLEKNEERGDKQFQLSSAGQRVRWYWYC